MNKGLSLVETLMVILITSIIVLISFSMIKSGNILFSRGYNNFLIQNDYQELITLIKTDLDNLKTVQKIDKHILNLISKKNESINYTIKKTDNTIKIYRNEKSITFKVIRFNDLYFEAYNKDEKKTLHVSDMILLKILISYSDEKETVQYDFEVFEI